MGIFSHLFFKYIRMDNMDKLIEEALKLLNDNRFGSIPVVKLEEILLKMKELNSKR